ncbi:phosphate ABC transporter, ATPase subunit [Petrotoga mobilis SJ95]|uniref:Phosphate ABC transporter, ATPase subunit n=1 Tax=Petrotoga mobilis (strain DSM 10674 / SJ95) TaxID=403833 RepID=A9BIE4_PETMO|nr:MULTISPECIES: phosphate ABC transporter ATP-binding protein PstB [Petrotoga]ABX32616.1 phosphate ABC transporter, ATPase subunit [Petrotoga mobilis SJ95]PNR93803.1 phosphate ABC transporter ATP-binding protein [Petrotoga sp. HWHPT.55.6.3]RLL86304.1 phosphate ABC transporter ATP-binding protein [Petrotoga sp. Shatin.DS.tank11.9.2.9.3]RLL88690.1 phosphate ABC transporter ATP-binding protein [Petrotoga sp. HKA.pet.4.5]RPD36061.1 phosphate ABC transporter ATP-binding protein [Petrotoga sp. HWH.
MNTEKEIVIEIKNFNGWYDQKQALKDINMEIKKKRVSAIIGPSGCGKSTLLRSINRINDEIPGYRTSGEIIFEGKNVYENNIDLSTLRKKIGMVFQKPVPFPMSIYENIAFGIKLHTPRNSRKMDEIIEAALKRAALWEEVKDDLDKPASSLSGGQQQRLCIARAIAIDPEIILLDEPTSALDPIATQKIENLIEHLSENYTIIIVTHNLAQAIRISDYMYFMFQGELIESGKTEDIIKNPKEQLTEDYLNGRIS